MGGQRCDWLHSCHVAATSVSKMKEIPIESSSMVTLANFKHSPATCDSAEQNISVVAESSTGQEWLGGRAWEGPPWT